MVSLALGKARVELAPEVGGAIAEFTFSGVDVLRRTPPVARAAGDVRAHACYPLVPYSNRIANARLAVTSGTVELARNFGDHPNSIHGVGWQRAWRVVRHDGSSALLALEHAAKGVDARAWPWPFRATQWFGLAADEGGATLTVKLALVNTQRCFLSVRSRPAPVLPANRGDRARFRCRWRLGEQCDAIADPSRRHPAGVAA